METKTIFDLKRWINWRFEQRGEKQAKVPYQRNGVRASVTNPDHWTHHRELYGKVGIVLGAGLYGIDVDNCIDENGNLNAFAAKLVKDLDSYAEVSPSGRGIHILCWSTVELAGRRSAGVELYGEGRYFTFTAKNLNGWAVNDRTEVLTNLYETLFPQKQYVARRPARKRGSESSTISWEINAQDMIERINNL